MNIWILNHYAGLPETVPATRTYDIAKRLANKNHRVTVFASSFSYYRHVEERLNNKKKFKIEYHDKVKFVWIKTFPYYKNDFRRLLNISEYAARTFLVGLTKIKNRPDVIIGTCVHPLAPLIAWILSKRFKIPFCYEVTDLWPRTLIDIGALKKSNPATIVLDKMETFLFKRAARIISLLPNIDKYVEEKGINSQKVKWVPNGVSLSKYSRLGQQKGTNKKFVVAFAGGFSESHGLEIIIKAAAILKDKKRNDIAFELIGNGVEHKRIVQLAKKLNLENVSFPGWISKKQLAIRLSGVTACIAVLKDLPLFKYGVSPNKIMDYFMAKKPIIYAINSSNNVVSEANAGFTIMPENVDELVNAILKVVNLSDEQRRILGVNGYNYAKENFSFDRLTNKYESVLLDLIW